MSYEHCEKHNQDATNGCPACARDLVAPWEAVGDAACGAAVTVYVPDVVIEPCTLLAGHEGAHLSREHSDVALKSGKITKRHNGLVHKWGPDADGASGAEVHVDDWDHDDVVSVVLAAELDAVVDLAARAEEEATQRAGAVRHLEATRAELVKVTAERDAAQQLEREALRGSAELRSEVFRLKARLQALGGAQIAGVAAAGVSFINAALDRAAGQQPQRRRLPAERRAVTHAFAIHTSEGRHKGYVTVGLYDDGTVGEVFLKLDQQGSQVSGFCDAWSIAVSMLLQTGTSLEVVCRKFRSMRFEPSGRTETPGIRVADSPVDYAARYLEHRFVRGLQLSDASGAPTPDDVANKKDEG